MPNPKRKHKRSRRDSRRANWKAEKVGLNKCPQCGAAKMPHRVCPSCGFYKNELIVPRKEKKKNEEQHENAGEEQKDKEGK